jgi:hypothetical protein
VKPGGGMVGVLVQGAFTKGVLVSATPVCYYLLFSQTNIKFNDFSLVIKNLTQFYEPQFNKII